jgi:hypothetical protein
MADVVAAKATDIPEEQAYDEPTESQPLLTHHESGLPETPKKRSLWELGMYVLLGVVGTALLGFMIKGFIDADDGHVSERLNLHPDALAE